MPLANQTERVKTTGVAYRAAAWLDARLGSSFAAEPNLKTTARFDDYQAALHILLAHSNPSVTGTQQKGIVERDLPIAKATMVAAIRVSESRSGVTFSIINHDGSRIDEHSDRKLFGALVTYGSGMPVQRRGERVYQFTVVPTAAEGPATTRLVPITNETPTVPIYTPAPSVPVLS